MKPEQTITMDDIHAARIKRTAEGIFDPTGHYPDDTGRADANAERAADMLRLEGIDTTEVPPSASEKDRFASLDSAYAGYLESMGFPSPTQIDSTERDVR